MQRSPASYPAAPHRATPSLWRACFWLVLSMLVAWMFIAWYGNSVAGQRGLLAATLSGAMTLAGALAALFSAALIRGPQAALSQLGLSMAFRMGLPLVGGLALSKVSMFEGTGVLAMVLAYYFVVLAVETPLSLRFIRPQACSRPS